MKVLLCAAAFTIAVSLAQASPRILLLGDSTVITSYLPEEQRAHRVLEQELKASLPSAACEISNQADNGEFIARYLLSGAYERMRASVTGADIIVVRFGANDEKRVSPDEYGRQLGTFVDLLQTDFPGACVILETGVFMDPAHYSFDRNKTLQPYWQKARDIAKSRGLICCDTYAAMERATRDGQWDQRIRKTPKGDKQVLDASQDAGKEGNRAWFSDIHPNAEGTRVAARELAGCIAAYLHQGTPEPARKNDRPSRSSEDYVSLLNFKPEQLAEIRNPPWRKSLKKDNPAEDNFQQPLDR